MNHAPDADREVSITAGEYPPATLHVMTWNIRRLIPGQLTRRADRWTTRAPLIREALSELRPTILGVQEALPEQTAFLQQVLGPSHRFVGRGRGRHHAGEATPIFYDTTQLELLGWEQQALSDTPETPGSVSWGNIFPRAFVAATFRHRATGNRFVVINTHLDPLSRRSRLRSARAIRDHIRSTQLPAVVTGDVNAHQRSATFQAFTSTNVLTDTWATAAGHLTAEWGTFPNYRDPTPGGKRIDWILSTRDWQVHRAGINARQYAGAWASDHLSVHALLIPPGETGNDDPHDR